MLAGQRAIEKRQRDEQALAVLGANQGNQDQAHGQRAEDRAEGVGRVNPAYGVGRSQQPDAGLSQSH